MPHFGVPYDASLHQGLTFGVLTVGSVQIPLVVAVDDRLDHHRIAPELAQQLSSPAQQFQADFALLTHNDPDSLNLVGGVAHSSQKVDLAFQVTQLPAGVSLVIGQAYLDFWHSRPWGLGAILSRKQLNCAPLP